jgi:NADH-quinone oxidoreductase subunit N
VILRPLLPEVLLVLLAVLVFAIDAFWPKGQSRRLGWFTVLGFGAILGSTILWARPEGMPEPLFGGMIRNDPYAFFFRLVVLFSGLIVAIFSMEDSALQDKGEYYGLLVLTVFGLNLMALASDLLMLYLAMELASLALYLLTGFLRENKSAEAGFKYFLFGAAASAVMLYGLSLLFGLTSQTNFYAIGTALASGSVPLLPITGAAILVFVGLGFKIAAVPFHFWAPDVYEGAPTPVTTLISVASKAAGFAVFGRVLLTIFPMPQTDWSIPLVLMAILTMTLGNTLALVQKNIKRLLAYSSVAQAGYILIGLAVVSPAGLAATIFYMAAYALTNLAAFGVVILVTQTAGSDEVDALAGLSRRSPSLALVLLVALLSLAGIPPLAGFMAKFFVFAAAIEQGAVALAIIGVLNAILGLYYYLTLIKVAYLNPPTSHIKIQVPRMYAIALGACLLGILALGISPSGFLDWATTAAKGLF